MFVKLVVPNTFNNYFIVYLKKKDYCLENEVDINKQYRGWGIGVWESVGNDVAS